MATPEKPRPFDFDEYSNPELSKRQDELIRELNAVTVEFGRRFDIDMASLIEIKLSLKASNRLIKAASGLPGLVRELILKPAGVNPEIDKPIQIGLWSGVYDYETAIRLEWETDFNQFEPAPISAVDIGLNRNPVNQFRDALIVEVRRKGALEDLAFTNDRRYAPFFPPKFTPEGIQLARGILSQNRFDQLSLFEQLLGLFPKKGK